MSAQELDDLALLTPDLASLGWTAEHDAWAATVVPDLAASEDGAEQAGTAGAAQESAAPVMYGRVARVSRGFCVVFTGGDAILAASSSDRATLGDSPATGDYVVVTDNPEDGPTLAAIAPRSSLLQRRASGRIPEPQVLAANADSVFVMHGLDRELNVRRIERQLVVAWDSGATPVVVLTKADAIDDVEDVVSAAEAVAPGVQVITTSIISGRNLDEVGQFFEGGRSVALMGLSGIGKSSLVNRLSDGRVQRTGEVRAADRRGRHTTVTRDLIPLPGGGFVIDAPGVREIGLWQAYGGLDKTFVEIAEAAARCRFADCEHQAEPGCAVRAGMVGGTIAERRVDHWRELQAELALQESQLEAFARRSESRDRADAEDQRDRTRANRRSRGRRSGGRRRNR